jgi:hypothetical protein
VRGWLAAAWLVGTTAVLACSLIYRPSDYFDPFGELTAIGVATDLPTSIVLTSSLVVYATGAAIFTLPKLGGDPQTLATLSGSGIAALVSNGTDLVAWCSVTGGSVWRPGWAAPEALDLPDGCVSIDVRGETVAAVVYPDPDASEPAYSVVVFQESDRGFSVSNEGGLRLPRDPSNSGTERVSLTDGGLYYASGEILGRNPEPGDSVTRTSPFCLLGVGGSRAQSFQVVELRDAGMLDAQVAAILSLYRGANGFRFGTNDTCCRVGEAGGNREACPTTSIVFNAGYQAIVIHDPYVYYLPNNQLLRGSVTAPLDSSTVLRSGFGEVVGSLAVDDQYAFFGVGNQILRFELPQAH